MADTEPGQGQAPEAGTPPAAGQAPAADNAGAQAAPTQEEKEIAKANAEAAKWRVKLRDTEAALEKVKAEAGDNKKLADQLADIQAQLAKAQAEADAAQKSAALTRLAVKAGVDPDVAALLDLSKIDLANEKAALETLAKLRGAGAGGTQVKPATNDEMRAQIFGPRKTTIFGG